MRLGRAPPEPQVSAHTYPPVCQHPPAGWPWCALHRMETKRETPAVKTGWVQSHGLRTPGCLWTRDGKSRKRAGVLGVGRVSAALGRQASRVAHPLPPEQVTQPRDRVAAAVHPAYSAHAHHPTLPFNIQLPQLQNHIYMPAIILAHSTTLSYT